MKKNKIIEGHIEKECIICFEKISYYEKEISCIQCHNVYHKKCYSKWLKRKKGYVFMPWKERAYILGNIKGVSVVTAVDDSDGTVCEALIRHRPSFFANGGDRKQENTPEMEICEDLGIHMLWNVGGHKIQSSSDLVESTKIIGDDDVSTF